MITSTNIGSNARMMGIVFNAFIILSILVNAALTAQFGWEHSGGVFGALIMLLFFDGAAIAWYLARKKEGLSSMQRGIAKLLSIGTIIASTLVSVIQVLLNTTLVAFSTNALETIGKGGLILVTVAAAANFLALFAFQYFSIEEQKAEQLEEQKARANDERQDMINEAHTKAHTKARARLMMQTDAIAERMANDAEREFYAAMDCLDMYEAPVAQPNKGAGAGAKKKGKKAKKATPTPPVKAANSACDCGMPIGTSEGECDYELGGNGCMIDLRAEQEKAAARPIDFESVPLELPGFGAVTDPPGK